MHSCAKLNIFVENFTHMKKLFILIISLICLNTWAQDSFKKDFVSVLNSNREQVVSLAEAMPEDAFSYKPSDEVRNAEKVMLHLAAANYFFTMTATGTPIPDGIDPRSMESSITGKEEVLEAVGKSYDFVVEAVENLDMSTLDETFEFPDGNEYTKRWALMRLMGHCYEHMGQLVAYARANDITPPWSSK